MLGPRGMSFVAHRSRVCVGFRHQGSPPSPAGSNGGCCGSLSPGPASIQVEHVFPQAHKRTSKAGHTHTQSTESSVYLGTHENMNNAAQFFPPSPPDQDGSPAVEYIHLPGRKVCSLQQLISSPQFTQYLPPDPDLLQLLAPGLMSPSDLQSLPPVPGTQTSYYACKLS